MPIVPKSLSGKLEFYESHVPAWVEDPAAIGLTPEMVAGQAARTAAARAAYDAHLALLSASKAATQRYYAAVAAMHSGPGAGADMVEAIKNFAQREDDPGVYTRALIPPPAARGTAPPPGRPYDFRLRLQQDGALDLSWACDNPKGTTGTMYEVRRSVDGVGGVGVGGPMEFVAAVGVKRFTDATIPAGAATIVYQITALRSTRRGEPAQFIVNFGIAEATASLRMAA